MRNNQKHTTSKLIFGSTLLLVVGFLTAQAAQAKDSVPNSIFSDPEVIELGKALFWDMQVGSGNGAAMACASCHYQAGADSEARRLASSVRPDGIIGSLGVRDSLFNGVSLDTATGRANSKDDMTVPLEFLITDRQSPPTVESEFEHNFWDGRANNCFNGVDPGGKQGQRGLYQRGSDGNVVPTTFRLCDASQASQAVGPPNSHVEMAAAGRTFPEIGFKMLRVQPLAMQSGDLATKLENEPFGHYDQMIKDAFGDVLGEFIGDEAVSGVTPVRLMRVPEDDGAGPTLIQPTLTEQNFSLFWGLSVMAYELTLESYDHVTKPTRAQEKSFKRMRCDSCHMSDGTSAAHVFTGKNGKAFISTGVSDQSVDPGVVDEFVGEDTFEGNFKTTHLFNLPLTAPYFHDGSAADLSEMLDFYIRGGNRVDQKVKIKKLKKRIKKRDKANVIAMMEGLTDPRIAEGSGPYAHPSLQLFLDDGSFFWMDASDDPDADPEAPGLSYGPTINP